MQTFAAQVKTGDSDLDVSITFSRRNIQIDAGRDRLGSWTMKECRFERLAPEAYEIRLPDERVHVRIPDDKGFRAALDLVRQEQGVLVPRPLLWLGVGAVAAAVFVSTLVGGEQAAEAQPSDASLMTVPSTTTPARVPTTVSVQQPAEADVHKDILDEWNDIAGGTRLELRELGRNELDDVIVTVREGHVIVEAAPSGAADNAEMIMSALGIAVASTDAEAAPAERAEVLANLGLRINAPNVTELHTEVARGGVHYSLDYEPGVSVRFEARQES